MKKLVNAAIIDPQRNGRPMKLEQITVTSLSKA
jgi:hypothetical protein